MEEGREQAGAALGMGTAAHRALADVGTTGAGSRREGLCDRCQLNECRDSSQETRQVRCGERQGQLTESHAVKRERRGWTGETIQNRRTGAGGPQRLQGWGAGKGDSWLMLRALPWETKERVSPLTPKGKEKMGQSGVRSCVGMSGLKF